MNPHPLLVTSLDRHLDGRPPVPPEHYLAAGRTAVRRRRRRRVQVAGGALAAVVAAVWALPLGAGHQVAREQAPAVATQAPPSTRSASSLVIEPGVGDIDAYTTTEIPAWATEYGNHGPATIAPDGRLWIAPEATVLRSIDDPLGRGPDAPSYAVETRGWTSNGDGPGRRIGGETPVWSFIYDVDGNAFGTLDEAGRWTADFGVWADDQAAYVLHRPRFAERLATFADDSSDDLVPGAGVEIVDERSDAEIGDRPLRARQTVAEVRLDGRTWFLLAVGKRSGPADYYEAYDEAASGATDLDGFLRFLREGSS